MTTAPDAPSGTPLASLGEIRRAAARLAGVTVRTPLLSFGPVDASGRPELWLKPESLQPTGAFKLRGAYHAIASLDPDTRSHGVVSHSSGNHAQGVARAARLLGVPATIVMPHDAPALKVDRVRADGAQIVTVGPSSDERAERARELAREHGLTLVAPYDDLAVICGQGTVGLEIVEQLDERGDNAPLTVLVPIGGGGLASGVATAVKELRRGSTVLGVEPVLAADARDSLRAGTIVRWSPEETARTSADGMRTVAVGRIPFAHLRRYVDDVVTVEESEIAAAMARAVHDARLVLEPSGATPLAAWLFHREEVVRASGSTTVAVLSGGNITPDRFASLITAARL